MPTVFAPVDVVKVEGLTIKEFFGNVASTDAKISAAHVKISAPGAEEWQTPEFDEWVLIVEGEVQLQHAAGTTTVSAGSGVFLKAGFRVRWVFPGPCAYVPICMPAFSPDNVHREEGGEAPAASEAGGDSAQPTVTAPVGVVETPALNITEFFGNVASNDARLSACLATVTAECSEAYQAPEFAEYVLVLSGEVHLLHDAGATVVSGPSAVHLAPGERVKWQWPGPCTYVPICLPAFSPHNCHREAEEGAVKDEEAMDRLRALHARGDPDPVYEFVYHMAQVGLWEEIKASKGTYYPPTYEQDGFTHATANPDYLCQVGNWFYTDVPGDWVCLRMSPASLASAGIRLAFEEPSPVGEKPALDKNDFGGERFPHIYGGIPAAGGVVLEEFPIIRSAEGRFESIGGLATPVAGA